MNREGHNAAVDRCESCRTPRDRDPLRSILMDGGSRESLCEDCFKKALDEGRVSPLDPRLPGENA